ncbi:MAG: hypothetical protein A3G33_06670 [Omnitrophica bacterium RIFCSPLOWO2_12_FULL_44_17]|uniref:Glycoamylase-like domain-containing protein n=1 Tax=Candidatus Danuiimicrobium aquiferis TaxID=1801832 RepID=A0A1G1L2J6_9BACT|nr:MAG: hypothetical protein A3B72_03245 [Omnitrophica bacterium RIFCSPHIGHO2_02_FULL_45_28]OGW92492.1 MAG: hypothetical protein A3E74_05915 [Omnitrophica bacterium RIFCSPHIGHO2_12_FULL_44_12]OGW99366.1 MAG: hypothetical protein A3G33_06670 [Omnitrophica bacterium RIFCSPLOWO2_12_FULL_44_17]OGX03240.1 MAG: hypothetical protein A3J12_11725 [Omnitrophica bacterium RIFCSPLOWO2_02_FULL_44_11]
MKKIHRFISILILFSLMAPFAVSGEREVKVFRVGTKGQLTPKQTTTASSGPSAVLVEPKVFDLNAKKILLIDDYEDGLSRNSLMGETGSWNLLTDNPKVSIDLQVVDYDGAKGSNHSLKISYNLDDDQSTNVGVWTKLMGLDASDYDHLQFEVKGSAGEEFTNVFLVELKKYKNNERINKIKGTRVAKEITSDWQTVSFPLNLMTGLYDQTNPEIWNNPLLALKDLDELVINFEGRRVTRKKGVLYFDNFRFVKTGNMGPTIMEHPEQAMMKTPVGLQGIEFARFLMKRLQGYPKEVNARVHAKKKIAGSFARFGVGCFGELSTVNWNKIEMPRNDRAFLKMVARDTWKFFDQMIDREHQLPLDTIQLGRREPIDSGAWIGDYINVTDVGVYLMCVVSAYDLRFISKKDAVRRIRATLNTVESLEHHSSGFLYNYYDTTTLAKTSYFVSLVDSGWLDAGLYVVKNAFPEELGGQCTGMIEKHNFSFFYDDVNQQMTHGYYANLDVQSDYDYGSFYTEPRVASYIAIGRGDVPLEHWFRMVRTFPEDYGWQISTPVNRVKRTTLGFLYFGGYYEWKGLQFVPSWGGSMFEALMPTLIIDEKKYAPEGLGLNDERHVRGQIRYALEDLKYPVWGMSPSSVPEGGYSEYGVNPLGSRGYKDGVVTPHATFLALGFMPKEAVRNARELIRRYDIYGEYGFYDAVDMKSGLVAKKYLLLDQAMILIQINNYLNHGAIRKRFHADAINEKALPLLKEEKFFD